MTFILLIGTLVARWQSIPFNHIFLIPNIIPSAHACDEYQIWAPARASGIYKKLPKPQRLRKSDLYPRGRFQPVRNCDIVQSDFDVVNEMIESFHVFCKAFAQQSQFTCCILPELEMIAFQHLCG